MPTVKDYFTQLAKDKEAMANISLLIKECRLQGITNPISIAAGLSVASKETGLKPQVEKDYSKTDIARIREVFPTKTAGVSDAFLNETKLNPVAWFNWLYGGRNGNRPGTNDGYTFRGRFLNQTTFRNLYEKLSIQLKLPELLTNPDKYNNDVPVAVDILIQFFKNNFELAGHTTLYVQDKKVGVKRTTKTFAQHYGTVDINGFTDVVTATNAFFHCNAGLGRTIEYIERDHTKGRKKALGRVAGFLDMVNKQK